MTDPDLDVRPAPSKAAAQRLSAEAGRRRTFAVISHPDAGKSTLTEALVLHARVITEAGAIHGKAGRRSTVSDWMEMEKARGISITSTALQFPYRAPDGQDCVINLLDTPGHADFSEDTYRVLTRRRLRGDADRRGQGPGTADPQAVPGVPSPRHPDHHRDQQVGPPGPLRPGTARRDPRPHRTQAHPVDLAGRHRRRLQGRAGPPHRQLHPVHPHRRRRHRRTRGAHPAGPRPRGRRRRLGQRGRGVRTAQRGRRRLRPGRPSWPARPPRCCSPRRR